MEVKKLGRLTEEMKERIRKSYRESPSYTKVAKDLGLNWRTVRNHVKHIPVEEQPAEEVVDVAPQAYKLFRSGKSPLDVAIILGLRSPEVEEFYSEYWRLRRQYRLWEIYQELCDSNYLRDFLELYRIMKNKWFEPKWFVEHLEDVRNIHEVRHRLEVSWSSLKSTEEDIQAKTQRSRELDIVVSSREELAAEAENLQRLVAGFRQDGAISLAGQVAEAKARAIFKDKESLFTLVLFSVVEAMKKDESAVWALLYPSRVAELRSLSSLITGKRPPSTDEDLERLARIGVEKLNQLLKATVHESIHTLALEHQAENKAI